MKRIRLFESKEEYNEVKRNMPYPAVSYVNSAEGSGVIYENDNPTFYLDYHWDENWTVEDTSSLARNAMGMFFAAGSYGCGGFYASSDIHEDIISFDVNGVNTLLEPEKKVINVHSIITENNTLGFTEESILEKKRIKSIRIKFSNKPVGIDVLTLINEGNGEIIFSSGFIGLDDLIMISDLEYEINSPEIITHLNFYNLFYSGTDFEEMFPSGYGKVVLVGSSKGYDSSINVEELIAEYNSYETVLDVEYEGSIENDCFRMLNKPYKVDIELKQDCNDQVLEYRFNNMPVSNVILTGKFKNPDISSYRLFSTTKFLEKADLSDTNLTTFEQTFYNCSIKSVKLPESTKKIDYQCFYDASNLTEIYCYAKIEPEIKENSFSKISTTGTLYYPKGSDYSTWLTELGSGWTGVEIDV